MPICFNGELIEKIPADLDRAIYYGDTLFETIRVFNGQIPLIQSHWERLIRSMEATSFDIPSNWDLEFFKNSIRLLSPNNARIRFTVWRNPGGLYLPSNNHPQYMVQSFLLESGTFSWTDIPVRLGICQSVKLPIDQFSNIKTMNGPRYVQAALEAKKMGWEDALILNQYNRVCEATSSNFFWWMPNGLSTIALTEGCVAGTMRSIVIKTAQTMDIEVFETQLNPKDIVDRTEIFLTNAVRGITPARMDGSPPVDTRQTEALFKKLREQLGLEQ